MIDMLLLLLTPGRLLTELAPEEKDQIDKIIDNIEGLANPKDAKELMCQILYDGFSEETKTKGRNLSLINKLNQLKSNTIDFYLQSFKENEFKNPEIKYNCDVYSKIGEYLLQLFRFRIVIQPEIQLTTNVHKQTKITYLTVKGFWINGSGTKERKFTKSLGRADEYPMGKDDVKAIEDATIKMQSILLEEYLKYYPEK